LDDVEDSNVVVYEASFQDNEMDDDGGGGDAVAVVVVVAAAAAAAVVAVVVVRHVNRVVQPVEVHYALDVDDDDDDVMAAWNEDEEDALDQNLVADVVANVVSLTVDEDNVVVVVVVVDDVVDVPKSAWNSSEKEPSMVLVVMDLDLVVLQHLERLVK
jgi:hypothetical protein